LRLLDCRGTLVLCDAVDPSRPMKPHVQVGPVPDYAYLAGNALVLATDRRLLVATEPGDGPTQLLLAIEYHQLVAVLAPSLGLLTRIRAAVNADSPIADLNPVLELRGENVAIVLRLPPTRARKLLALLGQHAGAPILHAESA
jgi:hypothetical protein